MHDDRHHIAAGYSNYNRSLSFETMEEITYGNDTKVDKIFIEAAFNSHMWNL